MASTSFFIARVDSLLLSGLLCQRKGMAPVNRGKGPVPALRTTHLRLCLHRDRYPGSEHPSHFERLHQRVPRTNDRRSGLTVLKDVASKGSGGRVWYPTPGDI